MGIIQIELFTTLDLVGQSPGGPDEDPDGFDFGGWQVPLLNETSGAQVVGAYADTDALLLGRRTYDIFADYRPHQDDEFGALFNRIPKYVASRGSAALTWDAQHNSAPTFRRRSTRSVTDTSTSPSSAASIWSKPSCPSDSLIASTSGSTPFSWAAANASSIPGRCPRISGSSTLPSRVRVARCSCATNSPTACLPPATCRSADNSTGAACLWPPRSRNH